MCAVFVRQLALCSTNPHLIEASKEVIPDAGVGLGRIFFARKRARLVAAVLRKLEFDVPREVSSRRVKYTSAIVYYVPATAAAVVRCDAALAMHRTPRGKGASRRDSMHASKPKTCLAQGFPGGGFEWTLSRERLDDRIAVADVELCTRAQYCLASPCVSSTFFTMLTPLTIVSVSYVQNASETIRGSEYATCYYYFDTRAREERFYTGCGFIGFSPVEGDS